MSSGKNEYRHVAVPTVVVNQQEHLSLHRLFKNKSSTLEDALMMIDADPAALAHPDIDGNLPLHIECQNQCRSPIIVKCIELYPYGLLFFDGFRCHPLQRLLLRKSMTVDVALLVIEKLFLVMSRHPDGPRIHPIHLICRNGSRIPILAKYIELYPNQLAVADEKNNLPLHMMIHAYYSSMEDILLIIDAYPAALKHQNKLSQLPIHIECQTECRSPVIRRCVEIYPEGLAVADKFDYLPLHRILMNQSASVEDVLIMMEKYPAALRHPKRNANKRFPPANGRLADLPLHIECRRQCRSAIIRKCIELYPGGLALVDSEGCTPLDRLLSNISSSVEDAMIMIEAYPAAVMRQSINSETSLNIECMHQCRSSILAKCMELYPKGPAVADEDRYLPLHRLLANGISSEEDALMMIEAYPAALKHENIDGELPLDIECMNRCRSNIIAKCIELYPESFDDEAIDMILGKVDNDDDIRLHASALSLVFTVQPMSLYRRYNFHAYDFWDIRKIPHYRRKILNLLPRHVFSQRHEADYADLNWQPRSAMLQLLSQIHQQSIRSNSNVMKMLLERG